MKLKDWVRSVLNFLHLDLTKNLQYDRLTKVVMNRIIRDGDNCIDIGCHKGEILDIILKHSPSGEHWAFEPIPSMYHDLKSKYQQNVHVLDVALSDKKGETEFHHVKNAPAYSGINKREYKVENPEIEKIKVRLATLDEIIPEKTAIKFIKIDVEGGELAVLKGAEKTIKNNHPTIIFETGLGAAEYYGTTPEEIFDLLSEDYNLNIFTLKAWIDSDKHLIRNQFISCYNNSEEYYFLAK